MLRLLAWVCGAIIIAAVIGYISGCSFGLGVRSARGDEPQLGDFGYRHREFHQFYQKGEKGGPLKRPHQPTTSCCDGDCRPVKAEFRQGAWYVYIDRGWEIVPAERVKRNVFPPDGGPHVCASKRGAQICDEYGGECTAQPLEIFCFVPPDTSS